MEEMVVSGVEGVMTRDLRDARVSGERESSAGFSEELLIDCSQEELGKSRSIESKQSRAEGASCSET